MATDASVSSVVELRGTASGIGRAQYLNGLRRAIADRGTDELARQGHSLPHAERLVVLLAVVVGGFAVRWSFAHQLALLVTDAQSHLVIARRLFNGPNAGIGQVGTVWLPLPHLLLAPFTLSTSWWRSGFGAAVLGVICLAVTCLAIFRTSVRATGSAIAGWASVVALLCTPTLLYMHTTAMTEPVLLATVCVTLAGVTRWETTGWSYSGGEVVAFCGAGAFFVVLSRYEGWAFVTAITLYIGVSVWRWKGLRAGIKAVRHFALAPALAGLLWLGFNALYSGDALAFQRGEGSSQAQMVVRRAIGTLPDYHRVGRSVATFSWVTQATCGQILSVGGLILTVLYAAGVGPRLRSRAPFAILAMGAFHVLSLWTGQTYMSHEYAVRYGIVVIPVFAVLFGWVVAWLAAVVQRTWGQVSLFVNSSHLHDRSDRAGILVAGVMMCTLTFAQFTTAYPAALLHQGHLEQQRTVDSDRAAVWAGAHYDGGLVLIDDTANPSLLRLGLSYDEVISSFSGPQWNAAVAGRASARWAIIDTAHSGDRVAIMLRKRPDGWKQIFASGTASVFRYDPLADLRASLSSQTDAHS